MTFNSSFQCRQKASK